VAHILNVILSQLSLRLLAQPLNYGMLTFHLALIVANYSRVHHDLYCCRVLKFGRSRWRHSSFSRYHDTIQLHPQAFNNRRFLLHFRHNLRQRPLPDASQNQLLAYNPVPVRLHLNPHPFHGVHHRCPPQQVLPLNCHLCLHHVLGHSLSQGHLPKVCCLVQEGNLRESE
jgi:hypothetical protein